MSTRTKLLALSTLVAAALAGCASAPAAPVTVQSATAVRAAPSSPITVRAAYPATLFYALDAASGARNRDPGYRAWIHDGETPPEWLATYAEARRRWTATTADSGGGELVTERCARRSATVDEAIACMKAVVPPSQQPILERAAREADARVRPAFAAAEARLTQVAEEMKRGLASDDARALFTTLRHEAGLDDAAPLRFEVVLVAKPAGAHSYAVQAGESLVHEVGPDETSGGLLGVAFHEIAHLAHHQSPHRHAMEEAFVALGDDGLFAANLWDEAVATAFGKGLAAERFEPGFSAERPMYHDARVSALGAALYRHWRGGADVVLGPPLAAWLTRAARAIVPPSERHVGDLLWSVIATAEERGPLDRFLRGVPYRSASRRSPLVVDVGAEERDMVAASRVTFATVGDLARHPALGERFALSSDVLAGAPSRVVRRTHDGPLELLIVAVDEPSLERAADALAKLPVPAR